jgi:hypothetical protein
MVDRRACVLTAVSFLAAGYALRAIVEVAQGAPDAAQDPGSEPEPEDVDDGLVPVGDVAGRIAERENPVVVRHREPPALVRQNGGAGPMKPSTRDPRRSPTRPC